jgi:hypothetical protein
MRRRVNKLFQEHCLGNAQLELEIAIPLDQVAFTNVNTANATALLHPPITRGQVTLRLTLLIPMEVIAPEVFQLMT